MNNLHLRDGKIAFRWKRWRNKKRQEVSYCLMVLFSGAVLFGAGGMALAGPTGGQVTSGTGTINQAGTTTTIDQTSSVLNINWQTFSTAPNETVNFVQPGSTSLAINRVVGGVPSYLQGALNANGRVFILNSAGITFAGTSRVNVGALLATTAMSVNGNVGGLANYSAPSGSGGSVINQGSITVSNGGFAILAAPYVQNTGFIKADLGTVALAGTNSFTLDLRGDGLINFVVPPGAAAQIAADGQKVGVDNSGTLQARSGQVIISANVATQVVNAVVNMQGVLDADALSPNGAGGSVLVTSTGDINLGGTITAQGNGTGAGGSIVTKAGGVDNIEGDANLLAAGGAEGKGGFIEVSGHNVVLNGNIHAGKGGEFLIDPATIDIATTGGTVNEANIEARLQAGTDVLVSASHFVHFTAPGATHSLIGGSGDLHVKAGNSITFAANDYVIRTGIGDVTMTASHGNIGDSNHRLSVKSGFGTDHGGMYSGVTDAGDIRLKAGTSIFLDDVTVISVPGGITGDRDARFQANAHDGTVNIAGALDVEASATGVANASATILILSPRFTVTGPATLIANEHGTGTGNIDNAFAAMTVAESIAVPANANGGQEIHFDNTLEVEAFANGHGANAIQAAVGVELNANSIMIDGKDTIKATATGSDHNEATGLIKAGAELLLERNLHSTNSTHFTLNGAEFAGLFSGIEVTANAQGHHAGNLQARAAVYLDASAVVVDGPVEITAHANGSAIHNVNAIARLSADQSFSSHDTSTNGINHARSAARNVFFDSSVNVTANANGTDAGKVLAQAFVVLDADSISMAGPTVTVKATAHGSFEDSVVANATLIAGRCSAEHATASESYNCHFGADTVHFANAIDVEAKANGITIGTSISALASAQLYANHIQVQGPVTLKATADNSGNAPGLVGATAKLTAAGGATSGSSSSAHNRTLIPAAEDIIFNQAIDVEAHASGSLLKTGGNAIALADVNLAADGEIYFGGNVDVIASATGHGINDSHRARNVIAEAGFTAGGREHDHQSASSGNSFQRFGASTIFLDPALAVEANAQGHLVHSVDASAHALLAAGSIRVDGPVTVNASANGSSVNRIRVNAILIAERSSANSSSSSEGFNARFGAFNINFGQGANIEAFANGSIVGNSVAATASAQLYGNDIHVQGPVTVKATADNSANGPRFVGANAKLIAAGGTSSYFSSASHNRTVNAASDDIVFNQTINVVAHANGSLLHSNGSAKASAGVHLAAQGEISVGGDVAVVASATGHGGNSHHEASYVIANAQFDLDGSGRGTANLDDITVGANANGHDVHSANGVALALFSAGTLRDHGLLMVTANVHGSSANFVEADAEIHSDLNTGVMNAMNFSGGFDVVAIASGQHVSFEVFAFAGAFLEANHDFVGGPANAFASANGSFASEFRADAEIVSDPVLVNYAGGFDVEANANGNHGNGVDAVALASIFASTLNAGTANVDGAAIVLANAHGTSVNAVSARAELDVDIHKFASFSKGFDVEAIAGGHNIGSAVEASATADLSAPGNISDLPAEAIQVGGPAVVKASASGSEGSIKLVRAVADLDAFASSMSFSAPNGQRAMDVEARANGNNIESGGTVAAVAEADLFGRSIVVTGPAMVKASASNSGSHDLKLVTADARLLAANDLVTNSSTGNSTHSSGRYSFNPASHIVFSKGISVGANAHVGAEGDSGAGGILASALGLLVGDEITVGGGVGVHAIASGHFATYVSANAHFAAEGFQNGHFSFFFNQQLLTLDSSSHSRAAAVTLTGGLDVEANADAFGASNVKASAVASLLASSLAVAGRSKVGAHATGSDVINERASAQFVADEGGTEFFRGAISVDAVANVATGGATRANAFGSVDLDASHSITVFGSGGFGPGFGPAITAVAVADPQNGASHGFASASVTAEAQDFGSGTGNLLVIGNVTALANAKGTGPNNFAEAFQQLQADNVTVVGNIRSVAFADGTDDFGSAEVQINAFGSPGNILLIETQDPIASAIAGTAHAFRQAHFSTEQHASGNNGSFAFADIDIRPGVGGGVTVLTPTTDQQLRLETLETDQPPPPFASSTLTEIRLSIRHHDCGVLGGAGNPEGKTESCEGPFNISETDTPP